MGTTISNTPLLKHIIDSDQRGIAIFSCPPETTESGTFSLAFSNKLFHDTLSKLQFQEAELPEAIREAVLACCRTGQEQAFDINMTSRGLHCQLEGRAIRVEEAVICYLTEALALYETPEFIMKMVENTYDMVAVVDNSHRYILFNAPYHREIMNVYGVDLKPGMTLLDAVAGSQEDYKNALPAWQHAFDGNELKAEGSFGDIKKDLYEYHFKPIKSSLGDRVTSAVLTVRNITRFRQLEEDSEDKERLQSLLNQSPDVIVKVDRSLTCQYINGSIKRFGVPNDKLTGINFYDLNMPDALRRKLTPHFDKVFNGERTELFDTFRIKGSDYDLHIIFIPEEAENGEVTAAFITCHDLTALNTLKQKFRAIFDGTFQFIGLLSTDGTILEANKAALDFIDSSIEEVYGQPVWGSPWFFADATPFLKESIAKAAKGEFVRQKLPIHNGQGLTRTIDYSLKPVWDENGQVVWLLAEGRDISELIEAEKRLEEIEEFTFMADNLPNLIWTADTEGNIQYVNDIFLKYTGLSSEEIKSDRVNDLLFHPDEKIGIERAWHDALTTGESVTHQVRLRHHSGSYCWHLSKIVPLKDSDGKVLKWHGSSTDIDEMKRTSLALNSLNRHLQELTDAMPVIVWTADSSGVTDYFNKRWRDYTGMEAEESILNGWKKVIHPDDLPHSQEVWNDRIKNEKPFQLEYRLRGQDGAYRWFLEEGRPYFDEEGNLLKWVGTATDIQEQHDASHMMALKAEEFRTMAETIPQVVWTANSVGSLQFLSHKWEEWTGADIKEGLKGGWINKVAEEDRDRVRKKFLESIKQGIPFFSEFRLTDAHGSHFWVLGLGSPSLEKGKVKKWFGTFTDISIQKEIEEYKDTFLRIAGHELRTPLTSLMATLGLLRRLPFTDPDFPDYLKKSYDASVRLKNLITDLLDISISKKARFSYHDEVFSLDNLIEEMVEAMQINLKTHTLYLTGETGVTLTADRMRIEQLFNNLLQNAVKYSPNGKEIFINSSYADGTAVVKIRDNGVGVDEADKELIFKKFYRADKHKNIRGMGLGLYLASSIAEHYGGTISVQSSPGQGSEFIVKLKAE